LSGDLAKAMALETVMKESRDRSFHTLASQRKTVTVEGSTLVSQRRTVEGSNSRNYSEAAKMYTTVPQVFARISLVRATRFK
jgi:hypothetical protein